MTPDQLHAIIIAILVWGFVNLAATSIYGAVIVAAIRKLEQRP